jgi:outer membrane lipoprotein-sorting protein
VNRTWHRWIPAVAVPAVVVAVAVTGGVAATASADLPEKTPQEVLALVGASEVEAFSGTLEQSSDLGLPDVSALSGGSGSSSGSSDDSGAAVSSALELATGSHTARIYADGPERLRVQVLDTLAERDAVRNGDDLWLYDSDEQTAVHATLPSRGDGPTPGDALSGTDGTVPTPDEMASRFLESVDPSTDVSLGSEQTVAGRDAYSLVLTPRTGDTLVGSVTIAVDAETGMPLEVQVFARGASSPAFEVGFTDLSLDTPSADLFDFTPPAGTDVTEKELDAPDHDGTGTDVDASDSSAHQDHEPTVTGEGWSSIVETSLGDDLTEITSNPLFSQLATPVEGGSVLQTALVSVLLTDDGRLLAGAVPAELLQQAAAAE